MSKEAIKQKSHNKVPAHEYCAVDRVCLCVCVIYPVRATCRVDEGKQRVFVVELCTSVMDGEIRFFLVE